MDQDLKVRARTIKFLEKNFTKKSITFNIKFGNDFERTTRKLQVFNKTKHFCESTFDMEMTLSRKQKDSIDNAYKYLQTTYMRLIFRTSKLNNDQKTPNKITTKGPEYTSKKKNKWLKST